jgi:nucleotide-binding universal stress UspA family protein
LNEAIKGFVSRSSESGRNFAERENGCQQFLSLTWQRSAVYHKRDSFKFVEGINFMAQIKTILFATDYSENSNRAFPYAAALAKAFAAKIVVMHVAEPGLRTPTQPLTNYDGEVETEQVVMRGKAPYQYILDLSRKKSCDLIVMATHGRSALAQFFMGGSTAEEVARHSQIPVFIIKVETDVAPETYTARLNEILYTTDFSEAAKSAFGHAATFAKKFGARLFVLHAIEEDSREFYQELGITGENLPAQIETYLKNYLSPLAGAEAVTSYHVVEGTAESEILKFIEAQQIDLVAIATQGHSGIQEDLLGSTTDRVIRQAPCPVLAVRGHNP